MLANALTANHSLVKPATLSRDLKKKQTHLALLERLLRIPKRTTIPRASLNCTQCKDENLLFVRKRAVREEGAGVRTIFHVLKQNALRGPKSATSCHSGRTQSRRVGEAASRATSQGWRRQPRCASLSSSSFNSASASPFAQIQEEVSAMSLAGRELSWFRATWLLCEGACAGLIIFTRFLCMCVCSACRGRSRGQAQVEDEEGVDITGQMRPPRKMAGEDEDQLKVLLGSNCACSHWPKEVFSQAFTCFLLFFNLSCFYFPFS